MNDQVTKPLMMAILMVFCLVIIMLSGCGTVAGFGKDVTGAAEWTKDKMSSKDK